MQQGLLGVDFGGSDPGRGYRRVVWEPDILHRDETWQQSSPRKGGPEMIVQRETPVMPKVLAFLAAADERSASLYPEESRNGPSFLAFPSADARFFVARQNAFALGCRGYVPLGLDSAEIKRLFVDPAQRGRGVGNALVQHIEKAAAEEGLKTLYLETGVKSSEAVKLYQSLGFEGERAFEAGDTKQTRGQYHRSGEPFHHEDAERVRRIIHER